MAKNEILEYQKQRMTDLANQRQHMIANGRHISLQELFLFPDSSQNFKPCIFAAEAEKAVEEWASKLGVWLPGISEFTNSMTGFLHSNTISVERLTLIGKFYILLFYIDDLYGNSKQKYLSVSDQQNIKSQLNRIGIMLDGQSIPGSLSPLEQGAAEVLTEFQATAPAEWLTLFKDACYRHLSLATEDQSTTASGDIHTVETFTLGRNEISGMFTTILLDEYGTSKYLDWELIKRNGLAEGLHELHFLCATICSYYNESFSMEMEVLDDQDDYNLIPILMLQDREPPYLTLEKAIYKAAGLLNDHTRKFMKIKNEMIEYISVFNPKYDSLVDALLSHFNGLEQMINASWYWEIITARYERHPSIFLEVEAQFRRVLAASYEKKWKQTQEAR
jgi:hypothetical protein